MRAQDEHGGLRRLLLEATRVQACVIGPFVVLFLLWGHQFLRLRVGPSLSSSASTLVVLVAGMLASSIQATATQILLAFHRQRNLAIVAIGEALVNIACSIVLARQMGIVGVALGTAIPTTITTLAVYLPYAARLLEVPNSAVLGRLLGPLLLCAVAYVGLLAMLGVLLDSAERHTYFDVARSLLRPAAPTHPE